MVGQNLQSQDINYRQPGWRVFPNTLTGSGAGGSSTLRAMLAQVFLILSVERAAPPDGNRRPLKDRPEGKDRRYNLHQKFAKPAIVH